MRNKIHNLLLQALQRAGERYAAHSALLDIAEAKEKTHGNYATNIAMLVAGILKCAPKTIAAEIIANIEDGEGIIARVEIAGPGFINFFIKKDLWGTCLKDILSAGAGYGRQTFGIGKKALLEFVSANPTGPLHIGHARGAVVGDVLARLLAACGYEVSKEYYINDAGNQMSNLGLSTLYRCRELGGDKQDLPEDCYRGDYLLDIARAALARHPEILEMEAGEAIALCGKFASESIMRGIVADLEAFGVVFDNFFAESTLYKQGLVETALTDLKNNGMVYRGEDGTLWFKSSTFGDEKDRVVVRSSGEPTYFAADIAYHRQKFDSGFDLLIDIWGADHHGYLARVLAGVEALGNDARKLRVILIQLVALSRDGKPVAMSTRKGEFVTMREVIDEVGTDAARYNFMLRRSDSHLDFDLELAKRQSNDNPVYYVQYAHARICSVLKMAQEKGFSVSGYDDSLTVLLQTPEEIEIIKALISFPDIVKASAQSLEAHRIAFFLNEVAALFHSYYNKHKVITEMESLTKARLLLLLALKIVIGNALALLGVSAPEKM